jgi:hypothetical protein
MVNAVTVAVAFVALVALLAPLFLAAPLLFAGVFFAMVASPFCGIVDGRQGPPPVDLLAGWRGWRCFGAGDGRFARVGDLEALDRRAFVRLFAFGLVVAHGALRDDREEFAISLHPAADRRAESTLFGSTLESKLPATHASLLS